MARVLFLFLCLFAGGIYPALATTNLVPFTINMDEVVNVTGTPRIAIDVGGTTRYATYTSGTGSATLIFIYTVQSGDNDANGVVLTSPVQLNGGTITDNAGNNANLNFTLPNTTGIIISTPAAPSGYTIALTDDTVTNTNKTNLSFSFTGATIGTTYNYTISSAGGGSNVTGSGTISSATQTISGIDVSGMNDGVLTASVTLSNGLTGAAVTDTIPKVLVTSNLTGHWTFDTTDISGTTAFDRSGSSNTGTLVNSPTPSTGEIGGALTFGGTTGLTIGNNASLRSNFPVTITAWIKPTATAITNGGNIFTNNNNVTVHSGIRATLGTSGSVSLTYGDNTQCGAGGRDTKTSGNNVVTANTWAHIAIVINGRNNMVLYVNGTDVGGTYAGTSAATQSVYTTAVGNIGGSVGCGTPTPTFTGQLDDVRFYNTALTAAQVLSLVNIH